MTSIGFDLQNRDGLLFAKPLERQVEIVSGSHEVVEPHCAVRLQFTGMVGDVDIALFDLDFGRFCEMSDDRRIRCAGGGGRFVEFEGDKNAARRAYDKAGRQHENKNRIILHIQIPPAKIARVGCALETGRVLAASSNKARCVK